MAILEALNESELSYLVERVFFKSIELLGGLKDLTHYKNLTWLPSMARASYVVVLHQEYLKSEEEIAQIIGMSKVSVRNILRADIKAALAKIEEQTPSKDLKVHVAGGIAKIAYKKIKESEDAKVLLKFAHAMANEAIKAAQCDSPWAYLVLKYTKGIDYPIDNSSILEERLEGLTIKGEDAISVIKNIKYPIKTPAILLHEIKEYLDSKL
ncbi:MAG: bacterio-opsin activator [Epsilonproteobacteria bacterium]|nr:bacterio-opsin activator [Campylobacterota bacterium]